MIILDTNVVSEALKQRPSKAVAEWVDQQGRGSLFVTAITQAEMLFGLEMLPEGKRKRELKAAAIVTFRDGFAGRILAFDEAAASHYADIAGARRRSGRPISQFDAMIAAIAKTHGFAIATRDEKGFAGCGVRVVNPWAASG